MKEKLNLAEKCSKTAERLKNEKQKSLSETLIRGKDCKEIREKMNCYQDFEEWSFKTGYSVSTLNRDINRYELYELMEKETGKRIVESLPVILLGWINKLQNQNEEKFKELVGLIDLGIDNTGIKSFLEENITEESMQLKGEELREYFEDLEKEVRKIDRRNIKHSMGKKITRAIDRSFKLISGCTKLRNRELSRKIEEINYGIGVVSIS
ncbi:hypothetical protein [Sebaldella sp. S0638]|uniref:hypothetical protein n=1 Tax=Sebaldella sp. S0638 TaxID=2957809 RepID=UPI00209D7A85|nr:hypothetical protein [Sebaldella sp. S0638]MCP1225251.1 hypothetical protein [Sebaldella sp. S0638]